MLVASIATKPREAITIPMAAVVVVAAPVIAIPTPCQEEEEEVVVVVVVVVEEEEDEEEEEEEEEEALTMAAMVRQIFMVRWAVLLRSHVSVWNTEAGCLVHGSIPLRVSWIFIRCGITLPCQTRTCSTS